MEVDFSARVTAYQSARERLELLKDGVPSRQNLLKVPNCYSTHVLWC